MNLGEPDLIASSAAAIGRADIQTVRAGGGCHETRSFFVARTLWRGKINRAAVGHHEPRGEIDPAVPQDQPGVLTGLNCNRELVCLKTGNLALNELAGRQLRGLRCEQGARHKQ